jgi:thioredoxin-related protein
MLRELARSLPRYYQVVVATGQRLFSKFQVRGIEDFQNFKETGDKICILVDTIDGELINSVLEYAKEKDNVKTIICVPAWGCESYGFTAVCDEDTLQLLECCEETVDLRPKQKWKIKKKDD